MVTCVVSFMQLVAHTTSRDYLAVSTGALEVLLKYLGALKILSLFRCLALDPSNHIGVDWVNISMATVYCGRANGLLFMFVFTVHTSIIHGS